MVNKEKIHRTEFNPPALSLEFHNFRRVEIARVTEGAVYKFGMIRELVLRGLSSDGNPVMIKLYGHFFRPEFDMLRLNIENRYNLKFPEKIIVWRLILVIVVPILLVLMAVSTIFLLQTLEQGSVFEQTPIVLGTNTPRPSATLRPTPTRTPSPTATPMPVEVTFDNISDYPTGQLVILVGRLALMSSTKCTSQYCGLLLENPAKPSQNMTIFVSIGTSPNQMKPLPDPYTKSDIQVILDDGTIAVVGYRIRITGRVCTTTSDNTCISDIEKIELFQIK